MDLFLGLFFVPFFCNQLLTSVSLQLKVDIDANRETAYVYNSSGSLGLAAQRHRLPIARYKDHILYLLEKHQVKVFDQRSKIIL